MVPHALVGEEQSPVPPAVTYQVAGAAPLADVAMTTDPNPLNKATAPTTDARCRSRRLNPLRVRETLR
jgi:hypothetical protein